jgi:hypothetical protein
MNGNGKRKRKKKSRSKVWKYIFITFLVLLIGGGGTIYYFLKIKTYDVADAKVEEIVEQDYDIVLPGEDGEQENVQNDTDASVSNGESDGESDGESGSETASDPSSGTGADKQNEGTQTAAPQSGNGQTSPKSQTSAASGNIGAGTAADSKKKTITVASIKQKYQPTFESLESQANERLNSLVSQAVSEYHTKKANDESISVTYFYRKYSEAGHALENSTDGAFQYVYSALEQDLKKNGFSSSHAETFKTEYENAKKARESALLDKAKSAL